MLQIHQGGVPGLELNLSALILTPRVREAHRIVEKGKVLLIPVFPILILLLVWCFAAAVA